jgi:hypothetical protein
MERFVKIIQKGTNSSVSCQNLIKIDKNEVSKNPVILNSNQEPIDLKKNIEQDRDSNSINRNNKNVNSNCNSINNVIFNNINISENSISNVESLPIDDSSKKLRKADTSLNVPLIKLNGKLNPFYLPIIGKKPSNFLKNHIIFCQIVDGMKPDVPFEALVSKFLYISKNHKNLFVYIYPDDAEDSIIDKQFKKSNIFSVYADNFRYLDDNKNFFISEECDSIYKDCKYFKQVLNLIKNYNISYLCASYKGLGGSKEESKESELNIKFVLKYIDIPTILFKESIFLTMDEKEKEKSKLNWLFIFDMNDTRCYTILEKFIRLIDPENDYVYGLTFLPSTLKKDDIELNFLNEMKSKKIKNYVYQMINNNKELYKFVIDLVNNGEVHFNFVVIYNKIKPLLNPANKREKIINNNNINIINDSCTNICVYSGL